MFIYWFKKYYCAYKISLESITLDELLSLFTKKFEIMSHTVNYDSIITDNLLIRLLVKALNKIIYKS